MLHNFFTNYRNALNVLKFAFRELAIGRYSTSFLSIVSQLKWVQSFKCLVCFVSCFFYFHLNFKMMCANLKIGRRKQDTAFSFLCGNIIF